MQTATEPKVEQEKISWQETTESRYDEMLGVVPPEFMEGNDFLLGEPQTHRRCRITGRVSGAYDGFTYKGGKYYATTEAVTPAEFDVLRLSTNITI